MDNLQNIFSDFKHSIIKQKNKKIFIANRNEVAKTLIEQGVIIEHVKKHC